MKTKNLILGLVALVFAVGSAFTSVLAPVDAYADSQLVSGGSWACRLTTFDCDVTPQGNTCKIELVKTQSPGSEIVSAKNSACQILTHTNGDANSTALAS